MVDNFKVNFLIGINIISPKLVIVDIKRKIVILKICNIKVPSEIKCNNLVFSTSTNQLPTILIAIIKLLAAPAIEDIISILQTLYQQKFKLSFFAAIAI